MSTQLFTKPTTTRPLAKHTSTVVKRWCKTKNCSLNWLETVLSKCWSQTKWLSQITTTGYFPIIRMTCSNISHTGAIGHHQLSLLLPGSSPITTHSINSQIYSSRARCLMKSIKSLWQLGFLHKWFHSFMEYNVILIYSYQHLWYVLVWLCDMRTHNPTIVMIQCWQPTCWHIYEINVQFEIECKNVSITLWNMQNDIFKRPFGALPQHKTILCHLSTCI